MKKAAKKTPPPVESCPCCGSSFKEIGTTKLGKFQGCPACFYRLGDESLNCDKHREDWVFAKMPWISVTVLQPPSWNAEQNLARLALKTALSKVKGRPPRMNLKIS